MIAILAEISARCGGSVLAVKRVGRERLSDVGVVKTTEIGAGLHRVESLVEKPGAE